MSSKYLKYCWILNCFLFIQCHSESTKKIETQNDPTSITALSSDITFTLDMANKMSQLAFNCIDQEYPNKLNQVLGDASYLKTPQELHPAFYGCFDWHSAVHGHWTLITLLKRFPQLSNREAIIAKIDLNLSKENILKEVAYFDDKHNKNYERTYGWAWILKLAEEMYTWDHDAGREWYENLKPLTILIISKYKEFLPKLNYPIRVGEHTNTAFGISFAHDYAVTLEDAELLHLIETRATDYYQSDSDCPLSWEPGGFDFLSPCIEEAEIMAKVLPDDKYAQWYASFIHQDKLQNLQPATASDLTDGKMVHLVGVNFSRAWCLYNIARKTQDKSLYALADTHIQASIDQVVNGQYAGEHWLASFAVMALTTND